MSILLSEVVRHTRLRHPVFNREVAPTVALASVLADYQRELIRMAGERLYSLVVDRLSIAFAFGDTDPATLLMTALKFGAVTGVPALATDAGVGVKIVAGLTQVDPTVALTVRYEDGLQLPSHYKVIGGTCVFAGGGSGVVSDPSSSPLFLGSQFGSDFKVVAYDQRLSPPVFPSGYVLNDKLYLTGQTVDWQGYEGIDLRYVPLPGDFTSDTQAFRVPDMCREALNARSDLAAAEWASSRKREGVDVSFFFTQKKEQEQKLMDAVSGRQSQIVRTLKRNR